MFVPKVDEDPKPEDAVLAAEDVVLFPNKLVPVPVDAGAKVAGSKEGDDDGILPKSNKFVSLFEAEVVTSADELPGVELAD